MDMLSIKFVYSLAKKKKNTYVSTTRSSLQPCQIIKGRMHRCEMRTSRSNVRRDTDTLRCYRDANMHFHPDELRMSRHIDAMVINTCNRDSIIATSELSANSLPRRTFHCMFLLKTFAKLKHGIVIH